MRAFVLLLTCAAGLAVLRVQARQEPPVPSQAPAFRGGVDVIQLDVSVLDSTRRPVRGLTAADFTVLENGRTQRIVTVSSVDAAERDPARSAWMRYATRDVVVNDLADALGDGRLFAIVFDDMNLPPDAPDILLRARSAARHIIEQMGPSDRAAVVFAQDAGKTQDFTDDQEKLVEAVDRLQPHPLYSIEPTPMGLGPGGGDMPQRFSSLLARSPCFRTEPVIPALDVVTSQLATVPGRRKTLFYIGVGATVGASGRGSCEAQLGGELRDIFRKSQRANVNIHTIDPGGVDGYRLYLEREAPAREQEMRMGQRRLPPSNIRALRDFLHVVADSTGGRAVTQTDAIESGIDQIFDEFGSYYLLGYETSNGTPDGKFRKVEVAVDRPGVTVRTRSGYWAPEANAVTARRDAATSSSLDLTLSGLAGSAAVPMRAFAASLGPAPAPASRLDEIAVVLSVRWPPLRASTTDSLTIVRNVYDEDGRAGPPTQEVVPVTLRPAGGAETRADFVRRLALAPGRYQLRFNVKSTLLNRTSSLFADLEVPDFARSALSLAGLVLGTPADGGAVSDLFGNRLPLVPTTARDFAPGDAISLFTRVFQAGAADPISASVTTEIFDAGNAVQFTATTPLAPEAFAAGGAVVQVALPFDRLIAGPYVLSVKAALAGGRQARRDLVFRIR
jgi:VWFA-related protein